MAEQYEIDDCRQVHEGCVMTRNLKRRDMGWECPKCGRVWSPYRASCDCIEKERK
jgi:uncharacterized OB-fold protein